MIETKIGKYPCLLHLPENPKEKLPLILFLHGAGERGDGGNLPVVAVNGLPRELKKAEYRDYPAVVVCPQCPTESFWLAELPFLRELLSVAEKTYGTASDRVIATGLSMGGFGTWGLGTRYPDLFAAIAPVCGGCMPWAAGALKMPVRAFHGTEDTVVDVRESIDMVRKAQEGGNKDVVLTLYPGVGHNALDFAYDKSLLDWFLTVSKKSETEANTEPAKNAKQFG
ncbi:MAG: dienelactone hydrolase family protein [Clostridia bacterium]|nr:dienelactone hydrolase family protein [Clostridia bacterium]